MAVLRYREKDQLERLLRMSGGFVLDFSDRTFGEFFRDFGVDIHSEEYARASGSKANRLRAFWDLASTDLLAAVLEDLITIAEEAGAEREVANRCRSIVVRLRSGTGTSRAPEGTGGAERPHRNPGASPVEVFFSYAHVDEDLMNDVRRQMIVYERNRRIIKWHDRMIPAGDEWRTEIDRRLERSHVVLLFMSPHFIESRYCYEVEGEVALRRHREGSARVIPIILRPCDWHETPFGELQALPPDGRPLSLWPDRDEVCLLTARGVMAAIG